MASKPNLTIDDIARELNVSKTTVSRAISGKGRISAATRERVRDYIEKHNYRPNAAAKGLAESRTYNVAMVIPHSFISLDLPYIRQSMSAICEEAFLHDYNVMVCLSTMNQSDPLIRVLDYRKVDGVILTRTVENDQLVDLLVSREIPFATLGSLPAKCRGTALVEVDHDHTAACYEFTRSLLSTSTQKTALLGNDLSYIVNQSRLSGFLKACQDLSLSVDQTPICMGINDDSACARTVENLLTSGVTRFVCMDDEVCLRTMHQLSIRSISIPDRIQVASLCDSDTLEQHHPSVSAVHFDSAELGRIACRELLKGLKGEPYDPSPSLGYEIRTRESTK